VAVSISDAYDELVNYLIEKASPQEILAFALSTESQERAIELLERNNAGTLTSDERAELEQMRQVDRLVSMLKARALEAINRS
jgi:hypothetical protein